MPEIEGIGQLIALKKKNTIGGGPAAPAVAQAVVEESRKI
jgi:hypothetical protein